MNLKTPQFWYAPTGLSARLLKPLSGLYWLGLQVDRALKTRTVYKPSFPVISIGNLTVGGSGKTPVAAFLAYQLARKGEQVAILSRGFGGKVQAPHKVKPFDTAEDVGDEPLMMATDLFDHGVSVWVGPNRVEVAKAAEAAGASVLLLDDGLQTWRLWRDINVLVVDGRYGFGNRQMLPAGPLREPLSALERCHFAVSLNGKAPAEVAAANIPSCGSDVFANKADLLALKGRNVIAFCGIGHPEKFFTMLENAGVEMIDQRGFGDHHPFTEAEMEKLRSDAFEAKALLVTTPKDYYRLPPHYRKKCHVVRPRFHAEQLQLLIDTVTQKLVEIRQSRTERRKKKR